MKKLENPKISCSCEGNHTCGMFGNAAPNNQPQNQDTLENMSLDTDSNSSAATNAGNEETLRDVPPMNEDSGIDTLLNADVPYRSQNTSPFMEMLSVPTAGEFSGRGSTDTKPSLSIDTISITVSINASNVSEHQSNIVKDSSSDSATVISPFIPPNTSAATDTRANLASNPGTPTHKVVDKATISSRDSDIKTSPSRPTSFASGLRRTYHEFSKTDTTEDGILKSIPYDTTQDMVAKKKKTKEETSPKEKSTSSSSGSRTRTSSTSKSVESRDTSIENLSGCSTDTQDDNDWYHKMRTRGPKISVTGSVRPDGTIDETEEHRSTADSSSFLSANPPPEGDICQDIYFGRMSPSLGGDGASPKKDENTQQKKDEKQLEHKEKEDEDA